LAQFLSQGFHGGTDIEPALSEAARIITGNDYKDSDIVLISDFEIPPMTWVMSEIKLPRLLALKTSFFGLVFGNQPEMDYLNLCLRYWQM
jgi:hypothetical protein